MNPNLSELLLRTDEIMNISNTRWNPISPRNSHSGGYSGRLHTGIDLGTAYTVLLVLDESFSPIAGAYQFAEIVRDGLVVDFVGAVSLVKKLKEQVENHLGCEITSAASSFPPGVAQAEVRATANVIQAAGIECTGLIDEPSAANNVLQIKDGAIVDVGGGTTGIAIIEDGKVIYTADEPTGGTHFSLVIAGAKNISFEEAESIKKNPDNQPELFPVIRPVIEKVGSIISRHTKNRNIKTIYLVGGTCSYPGMDRVIEEFTGIQTKVPGSPLFVTPLGIAMYNR